MILHAASIAAFFLDQLAQTPVQIQCVQQTTQESWLKQWIPTAVSLLSIGIGVWIARWSFSASSKRDRVRWGLDQKKAEWSAILSSLTIADIKLPHVFNNVEWPSMSDGMLQDIRNVLPVMRNTIFIADVLDKGKIIDSFQAFVSDAAEKIEQIKGSNKSIEGSTGLATMLGKMSGTVTTEDIIIENRIKSKHIDDREKIYAELFKGFHEQADKIRKVALVTLHSDKANAES